MDYDQQALAESGSDHLAGWAAESAACDPGPWEKWIDEVERLLGHSADGDGREDGYSMDNFFKAWEGGQSAADAVADVRRTMAAMAVRRKPEGMSAAEHATAVDAVLTVDSDGKVRQQQPSHEDPHLR